MTYVVGMQELPRTGNTFRFEGHEHGDATLSFFLTDARPAGGPSLHRHPYAEVFVVQDGRVTFTVADETLEEPAARSWSCRQARRTSSSMRETARCAK